MKQPGRIALGNLPTRIEPLKNISAEIEGINIFVKRDDYTGSEYSGNKIRKLEFVLKDAMEKGCDCLITCGGIQSNHARATTAIAVKNNMKPYLVLKGEESDGGNGNHYLDVLFGAEINYISEEEYKNSRNEIMASLKKDLESQGHKPYIIPEGASNGIGNWGYVDAYKEIKNQEKELGIEFDAVAVAVGSGSTYAGLLLGAAMAGDKKKIFGLNIYDAAVDFKTKIWNLLLENKEQLDIETLCSMDSIEITNEYVGRGYAKNTSEELKFIRELARKEGLVLDSVYTGKAFRGLIQEIKKGQFEDAKNILFIHTGGIFGVFPNKSLYDICK